MTTDCLAWRGIDLAGDTLLIETPTGAELRAASDGRLLGATAAPGARFGLERNGTYAWGVSATALKVWSRTGQVLLDVPGDFSRARLFADIGAVRIGLGPAGDQVIERIDFANGARTTGAFIGTFHDWFGDGQRFISYTGNVIRIYSVAGVQEALADTGLGGVAAVGGFGAHFWTPAGTFRVDAPTTPVAIATSATTQEVAGLTFVNSLSTLTVFTSDTVMTVTPTSRQFHGGIITASGASPQGHWAIGTHSGVVVDGRHLAAGDELSCGQLQGMDGTLSGHLVVAVAEPKLLAFSGVGGAGGGGAVLGVPRRMADSATRVDLSADGTLLAISTGSGTSSLTRPFFPPLRLLRLPEGQQVGTWARPGFSVRDLRVAANGTAVSYVLYSDVPGSATGTEVIRVQDNSQLYVSSYPETVIMSPGGELLATHGGPMPLDTSKISRGQTLVNAVDGTAVIWLDDNRLVTVGAATSSPDSPFVVRVYDATGRLLSSAPTPSHWSNLNPEIAGTNRVYVFNSIYDVVSGARVWTGTCPIDFTWSNYWEAIAVRGTIAGPYALYLCGQEIIAERY